MSDVTRREFIADGSKLTLGAMVVPRRVLGGPAYRAPSDTLNIAIVGMGQQGTENTEELVSENIVAVCDVDFDAVERFVENRQRPDSEGKVREKSVAMREKYLRARRYHDFRIMLERQRDIDAVLIATPDHLHAPIAKAAMEAGKHVYVQKPLTWSVHEARVLRRLAESTGVVTQMGNQGHSSNDARRINEWIQAGVIGPVHEVHVWTNRPIWPQGVPRPYSLMPEPDPPRDRPSWGRGAVTRRFELALSGDYARPDWLHWDLYLGPVAKDLPWHPIYHPFNWRGWVEFGVGALGDMGAHLLDHPYWALGLTFPTEIEATSTPWGGDAEDPASYPLATKVHYTFPAEGDRPAVRLHWYDGGLMPRRPDVLPDDIELDRTGGVIFVGERGILMHETYGAKPQLFPAALEEEAAAVPETMPRIEETHHMNWVRACKGETQASCPFDYAAPLTEVMLLGIVALRAGQGRRIRYDADRMLITNAPEANAFLTREYRPGWEV